ncbi:hypothetical protein [Priestia koreensis]|uniref:hypothetical protein n=1 Tax=Priestia koreensis TaxID=284581 RepID=UPI00203FBE7F|nr:hypothetical protein [Priestia koreensis]MCM3006124.1 hypothetical protein [Priestia koreensis]
MKLYYDVQYSLTKNDLTKELLQRINSVLTINRNNYNYFYLADHYYNGVSAVKRILKKFPEMEPYAFEYEEEVRDEKYTYWILSNFPKDYSFFSNVQVIEGENKDNIDFEILLKIAEGIPRSFPLFHAVFLFDQIDWSQNLGVTDDSEWGINSIRYINDWWTPKRAISLHANVSLELPSNEQNTLPLISEETNESLLLLGNIKKKSLRIQLNEKEKRSAEDLEKTCHKLIVAFRNDLSKNNPVVFPHQLSEPNEYTFNIPRKPTILKIIKKLGYKHLPKEGFHGAVVFGKLTEKNHQILLEFDSGSTFANLRCNLIIKGPYWEHRMDEIPCTPKSHGHFVGIPDLETLEKVVENFCAVIPYLENTIINDIENLYGPAPKWFNYRG